MLPDLFVLNAHCSVVRSYVARWKDALELSLRFGVNYLPTHPINSCKGTFQNRNLDQVKNRGNKTGKRRAEIIFAFIFQLFK